MVWFDSRNNDLGDIYFNRSLDGGATWLAADRRLDTDAPGNADSSEARICCTGEDVYVAWMDWRNGDAADVYFNYSRDGGATWAASDQRLNTDPAGVGRVLLRDIACCESNVFVAWYDWRVGPYDDLYVNVSGDYGAHWLASDLRVDSDASGATGRDTAGGDDLEVGQPLTQGLCCFGTRAGFAWTDNRFAGPPVPEGDPPGPPGTDIMVRGTR